MVLVHCISRSQRLKKDFQDENLKIFLSETRMPRALIFGTYHLVDLCQVCSNYTPGAKNGPTLGVKCFTKAYIGKHEKNLLLV